MYPKYISRLCLEKGPLSIKGLLRAHTARHDSSRIVFRYAQKACGNNNLRPIYFFHVY